MAKKATTRNTSKPSTTRAARSAMRQEAVNDARRVNDEMRARRDQMRQNNDEKMIADAAKRAKEFKADSRRTSPQPKKRENLGEYPRKIDKLKADLQNKVRASKVTVSSKKKK